MKVLSGAAGPGRWPIVLQGAAERFPRLAHVFVDQGHTGGVTWIEQHFGWTVEVVKHPPGSRVEWVPHGDLGDWRTIWFTWLRPLLVRKGYRDRAAHPPAFCRSGQGFEAS